MRTRLGIFVVVAGLFLSGCGFSGPAPKQLQTSTTTTTSKARVTTTFTTVTSTVHDPLVVEDSGYSIYSAATGNAKIVSGAIVVKNPNPVATAIGVRFDMNIYTARNQLLTTVAAEIPYIYPGQTAAFAKMDSGVDAARVEFSPITQGWINGSLDGELTVSDVRSTTATFSTAYADVTSTIAVPITKPIGTIVFRDASGKLLGGASDPVEDIPANGAVTVRLKILKVPPETRASTMYVTAATFGGLFRLTPQLPAK